MDSFCFCGFCVERVGFGVMSESTTNRVRCQQLLKVAWPLIINSSSFALLNFFDRLFCRGIAKLLSRFVAGRDSVFYVVCGFMALAGITNICCPAGWAKGYRGGGNGYSARDFFWGCSIPIILLLEPVGVGVLVVMGHAPEVLS